MHINISLHHELPILWLKFPMENVKFEQKWRELKMKSKHWQNDSNSQSRCSNFKLPSVDNISDKYYQNRFRKK